MPAHKNLIERILDLPAELRRLTFLNFLPGTLRLHYYESTWPKDVLPVRLAHTDTSSAVLQEFVFWLSDDLVTKAWHEAITEHINTITLWDLGEVEQLKVYLDRGCKSRPVRQQAFFQRLKTVQRTSISIRPIGTPYGSFTQGRVRMLLNLREVVDGNLPLSTVRLHLDGLVPHGRDQQDLWAITVSEFARFVSDNKKAIHRPLQVKISCPESELSTRKMRNFLNRIHFHCGNDTVRWIHTGDCRYQGRVGDLTVTWKGEGSVVRIKDKLLLLHRRSSIAHEEY